jgi:hypothetical protein
LATDLKWEKYEIKYSPNDYLDGEKTKKEILKPAFFPEAE